MIRLKPHFPGHWPMEESLGNSAGRLISPLSSLASFCPFAVQAYSHSMKLHVELT